MNAPFLALSALPPIKLQPTPPDFDVRETAVALWLSVAKDELTKFVQHAADNDPTHLINAAELKAEIDATLTDLCANITGKLRAVAEQLTDDLYGGIAARGPMHRSRR